MLQHWALSVRHPGVGRHHTVHNITREMAHTLFTLLFTPTILFLFFLSHLSTSLFLSHAWLLSSLNIYCWGFILTACVYHTFFSILMDPRSHSLFCKRQSRWSWSSSAIRWPENIALDIFYIILPSRPVFCIDSVAMTGVSHRKGGEKSKIQEEVVQARAAVKDGPYRGWEQGGSRVGRNWSEKGGEWGNEI